MEKNVRVIYIVEGYTSQGDLHSRRYGRNKKTAEKLERIAYDTGADGVNVRRMQKAEYNWIDPEWVESLESLARSAR